MAEQQQFPRSFDLLTSPRLVQPIRQPSTPNNSASSPAIYRGGNDSTLPPSTNFHPVFLPNSAPSYSLLANGGDALTRESSRLLCSGTDHACPLRPVVFDLQVEIAKLEMEIRQRDQVLQRINTYLGSTFTPMSTSASVQDQLGQLTIGSPNTSNRNNNWRGRSLERPASPSNALNLNARQNLSMEELRGSRVLEMATHKDHYEALKNKIKYGNVEEINFIYEELKGHIPELCENSYGSQVLVELLNLGHREKIHQVFTLVLPELVSLCYDPNGNQVINKLVECVAEPEQITGLFLTLRTPFLQLSQNAIARSVIERCISIFPRESDKYFMVDKVLGNCMALATDKHGCRVLQKCLEHANSVLKLYLMDEILKDILYLTRHFYGNYVVQCAVNQNIIDFANRTMERLKGNFVSLSMHKYSSNVVEKILKNVSKENVREIIKEIVEDPNVLTLFEDQFGNYVIQKALAATAKWPNIFDAIAKVIEKNYSALDCHMYGKRVISCLMKLQNERRSYRLMSLEEPSDV